MYGWQAARIRRSLDWESLESKWQLSTDFWIKNRSYLLHIMATKFIRHIVFFQRKALLRRRLHSNQMSSRSPVKNNSSFREPTPEQKEWYKTRKNTTDAIYDKVVKGYWIGPTFLSVAALWHVLFSKKDESCGLDHLQKIIPNKNCSTTSTQPLIFKNTSPSSFSGDS